MEIHRTSLIKHFNWNFERFEIRCILPKDQAHKRKVYCSRIIGPDPNYILARDFLYCMHMKRSASDQYAFFLEEDGIYEFAVKTIAPDTGYRSAWSADG